MNKSKFLIGFLVFTTAVIFNSGIAAQRSATQTMRGKVVSITKAKKSEKEKPLATVFVERVEESESNIDKAYLLVTDETKIFMKQGNVRKKAKFDDIKKGAVVFARLSNELTIMIYPLRIVATEIVIMRGGAKSKGK